MIELEWEPPGRYEVSATPRAREVSRSNWQDALTLVLVLATFICVAANVQNANWVEGVPPLYPIIIVALIVACLLSRLRVNQLLLLPAGLFIGAALVYFELMALLAGGSLYTKTDHLLDRMYVWWSAVTQHGTSVDPLPVIVIMLVATWLGSFLAAWAVFRWRNAVLGLLPGAAALTWDAWFSDGEFSMSAVLYLILGVLLFMRLRVAREERRWHREDIPHPPFIALSAMHLTFWATCALFAAVLVLPGGPQSGVANARWSAMTGPITRPLTSVAGAFISINPDKGLKIHALRDALILQGRIDPGLVPAAQVTGTLPPDVAPFLRDQSFEQYRRDGWHVNEQGDSPLAPGDSSQATEPEGGIDPLARKSVSIKVKVQGGNGDRLLSVGQPLKSDHAARASTGPAPDDVSSLEAEHHLSNGTKYTVIGSVSAATVEQLRSAGTGYPDWVTQSYLQVSRRLPARVGEQAKAVAAGTASPYDAATAIETYLRTFPIDNTLARAPDGQDPVDYFLFDAQRGYFDYYASAMTVMLRTLGIPARLASGFVLDPSRLQDGATFKLTQQQSFAWPEVYFPSIGWVEFNPTPSEPVITRPTTAQTSLPDQPPLTLAAADGSTDLRTRSLPSLSALAFGSWHLWRTIILVMAGLIIVGAIGAALFAWEFRLRGLGLESRVWEKSLALATLAQSGPEAHETPRAYAERLAASVQGAGDIRYIASSYERARFGNRQMSRDEARRLRDAWTTTRGALLRRILRLRGRGFRRPEVEREP